MYIHTYNKELPDSSNENIRSILMVYASSAYAVNSAVSLDIVQWFVKLHEIKESQILIRVHSEYFKVEG
ncbi:g113 [Yersinia phage phiR1-37]|uniref:hypothetical protein n=1 Tax=Yersinia phage phiR1-37 TaxID=331278 RepID=UPI00022DBD1D|nr:hypothetical protein phiR1-37_gp113 [Yersinia phage phiR1-37]CCE26137.1 g113 [Yersinia phage phiR1-37]